MTKFQTAFYLGEEKKTGYSGVVAEEGLFLAFEAAEGMTHEEGRDFLKQVKTEFLRTPPGNLSEIDNLLSELIREKNLALGFSLALGFVIGNALYLKSVGTGEVLIRRKNKTGKLISGDNSASGFYQADDIYVFTTGRFIELAGGEEKVGEFFDHRNPQQIVEEIAPVLQPKRDHGAVAIFLQIDAGEEDMDEQYIRPMNFFTRFQDKVKGYYLIHGKRKTMTLVAVILIFAIFMWSIVLGQTRRSSVAATEKIKQGRELVVQKLNEAEEVSFLNTARANAILDETKSTLAGLKKSYPKRSEIAEIEQLIKDTENRIYKKEEVEGVEFFDLAVDSDKASGSNLYLDGENLLILDKVSGVLYNLSLEKKSLTKSVSGELKKASLVAMYSDKQYFYSPGGGIFTFDASGKASRVIENDLEWGNITGMATFNGNLYMLDSGKSDVYKYVPVESGFGAKTSYFNQGQSVNLSIYKSIAIDSSVYLAGGGSVIKFSSGSRAGFAMNLPSTTVNFNKIFASRDLDRVYGWDKSHGVVYVMGKGGDFEKQIKSDLLSKGQDLVVYNDEIYILINGKIYVIE